jgi:hypothetical protein
VSDEVSTVSKVPGRYQGEDWAALTRDAVEVYGADLEKGAFLVGVPFVIVEATFRPGIVNARTDELMFYASLDVITGDSEALAKAIRRNRIPEENIAAVEPNEHLVINEGGTGVYRQIVAYLEAAGAIRITSDLGREGRYGESRFDLSPREWDVNPDHAELRVDGAGNPTLAFPLRLLCPRGLRASEYENEYSKAATTRYIA